ncbi:hypothetical protein Leryth_013145 [Lithospermum erythrorhizon]|nr:hypothetical protein Leryth_013145 [Lithospermum erythrorhizon]
MSYDFLIDSRASSDIYGFIPFLRNRNIAIDSISVEKAQLKVFHPVIAVGCYSNSSGNSLEPTITPFNFLPFTVATTSNLLFVTGCNTYGIFQGQESVLPYRSFVFGCISFCEYSFKLENTSCTDGYGCCQTTVPPQLTYFNSSLNSLDNNIHLDAFGDCSYSFMADKSAFNDNILRHKDSINASSKFPMVLSWFMMSNKRCGIDLQNSNDYACKEGSSCQNAGAESYRCVCSNGYEGNPYLGCTDIDECATHDNDCEDVCVNKRGGYTCECRAGYHGDGTKNNGTGCIQIKRSNKSIVLAAVGGTTLGISLLLVSTYLLYKTVRKRRDRN